MSKGEIAIKKALFPILLAVILAFAAAPNRGPQPEYALGERVGQIYYEYQESSFAAVIARAPIVAEVVITRYHGSIEESTQFHCTLYEARITTCYKNTTGKELSLIPLVQDGTTDWTFSGFPLFQTGDRLLLAIAPCSNYEGVIADTLSGYYLVDGCNQTAMQIVESKDGEVCHTFMPDMLDLPTSNLTEAMLESSKQHVMKKHGFVEEKELETIPPYRSAAYCDIKEMIRKELGK